MQGIYTRIPETNYVPREYGVAAILLFLFMVLISLVSVLNLLYFYLLLLLLLLLFTAIGSLPVGSGYFTCIQNMKLVTTEFKLGGLHEKHVVVIWSLGNHLSICL